MFAGLNFIPFYFSHPPQLLEHSFGISHMAAPQRSILSCNRAAAPLSLNPLDLHSLLFCNLEINTLTSPTYSPTLLCSVSALLSFPEAHLCSVSLMSAGPLYQWAMVTASLFLSSLSLCLSLSVCNKTLGPAVALIELWDHISVALEEFDSLSMALCCCCGSH